MAKNPDNTIGQGIPSDAFDPVDETFDPTTYTQIEQITKTPLPDTNIPTTPGEGIPSDAFDLVDRWVDPPTYNAYPELKNRGK